MLLNLYSFVDFPFTKNAKFNFDNFENEVKKATQLIDDMIDLELEKIDGILDKIKSDKEPDNISCRPRPRHYNWQCR